MKRSLIDREIGTPHFELWPVEPGDSKKSNGLQLFSQDFYDISNGRPLIQFQGGPFPVKTFPSNLICISFEYFKKNRLEIT